MGSFLYQSLSLNVREVFYMAETLGLPEPSLTPEQDAFVMTAAETRQWIEFDFAANSGDVELALRFGVIRSMMYEHASNYLWEKSVPADEAELGGGERKNYFRQATKEYRLYFV